MLDRPVDVKDGVFDYAHVRGEAKGRVLSWRPALRRLGIRAPSGPIDAYLMLFGPLVAPCARLLSPSTGSTFPMGPLMTP